jgi:hemerythrin
MAKFVWSEQFNVGIEVIDKQHRQLVEYVNQLEEARSGGQSQQEIGKLINQLVDHTIFHFGFEEGLQEKVGYPYIKAHQKMHVMFAKQVSELQARFKNGEDVSQDIDGMLVNWLMDHLKHDDADFVPTVKEFLRLHPDFLTKNLTEKKGLIGRIFN